MTLLLLPCPDHPLLPWLVPVGLHHVVVVVVVAALNATRNHNLLRPSIPLADTVE
jgi:hypothetical protein